MARMLLFWKDAAREDSQPECPEILRANPTTGKAGRGRLLACSARKPGGYQGTTSAAAQTRLAFKWLLSLTCLPGTVLSQACPLGAPQRFFSVKRFLTSV